DVCPETMFEKYDAGDRVFFVFTLLAAAGILTLSLHDALPISAQADERTGGAGKRELVADVGDEIGQCLIHARQILAREAALHVRSEEHTSELQSQSNLVCRLLLEKKNPR